MSRLLLDTHTYLWFVFDDPRLSADAAAAIAAADSEPMLSIASLWEITIKRQLGKLELGMDLALFLRRFVEERRVTVLPVGLDDLLAYAQLPLLHRDPFDRLLVAQARVLGLTVVSADPNLRLYGIDVVW